MDSVLVRDSICLSHFINIEVEIHHLEGIGGLKLHNHHFHLPRLVFLDIELSFRMFILNIIEMRTTSVHHYVVYLQTLTLFRVCDMM